MTEITERKELNLWLSGEPLGWRRVTVCIGNYAVAIVLGLTMQSSSLAWFILGWCVLTALLEGY